MCRETVSEGGECRSASGCISRLRRSQQAENSKERQSNKHGLESVEKLSDSCQCQLPIWQALRSPMEKYLIGDHAVGSQTGAYSKPSTFSAPHVCAQDKPKFSPRHTHTSSQLCRGVIVKCTQHGLFPSLKNSLAASFLSQALFDNSCKTSFGSNTPLLIIDILCSACLQSHTTWIYLINEVLHPSN